jgi:drug/metabolite transporter (DMT)-like permease
MRMNALVTFVLLVIGTSLEAGGDAIVRTGLRSPFPALKIALLALGGLMLFGYGVFVTSAPVDFGKLLGLYVVLFFITAQVLNALAFGVRPTPPILVGGLLIVAGGAVIALWKS